MLAAASKVSSSQELFKLVLNLISSGAEIPVPLKEHFVTVLSQAKNLARTSTVSCDVLPESIDLAFEISVIDSLSKSLEGIDNIENVSPALANELLISMEQSSVY